MRQETAKSKTGHINNSLRVLAPYTEWCPLELREEISTGAKPIWKMLQQE